MLKSAVSLSRSSLVLVLGVAAATAAGCSSDQPKRSDDAGDLAAPVDAGNDRAVDADAADDAIDADGPRDAGDVPVVEQQVDAGHMGDTKVDPLANPNGAEPPTSPLRKPTVDPLQVTIFNRLLVKPKVKLTQGQVKDLVEEATGQKLELVRKTAGTFWLLQFAPTKPARTAKEQKQLMATLEKSAAFVVVEGDQIMTIK